MTRGGGGDGLRHELELARKVLLDLNLAEQDQNAEQAAQPADIPSEPVKTRMSPAEIRTPSVKKAQVCLAKAQAHRDRAKREGAERQHPSSPVVPKQNSAVRRARATGNQRMSVELPGAPGGRGAETVTSQKTSITRIARASSNAQARLEKAQATEKRMRMLREAELVEAARMNVDRRSVEKPLHGGQRVQPQQPGVAVCACGFVAAASEVSKALEQASVASSGSAMTDMDDNAETSRRQVEQVPPQEQEKEQAGLKPQVLGSHSPSSAGEYGGAGAWVWRPPWCGPEQRPLFYAVNGNGFPSVAEAFVRRGYERLAFSAKDDVSYAFRWVQQPWEVDFNAFRAREQLVNVVSGVELLCNKAKLIHCLQAHALSTGLDIDFMPPSIVADSPEVLIARADRLLAECSVERGAVAVSKGGEGGLWLLKPSTTNQGTGIIICTGSQLPQIALRLWAGPEKTGDAERREVQAVVGSGRGFVRKGTRSTAALIATGSPVQPAVSSHSVVTPPVALEASTRVPCECQVEECSDTPPEGEDRPGREHRLQGGELGSEMDGCRLIDNDRYTTAIDLVGLDADGCLVGVGGEVAHAGNPRVISQMAASPPRQEDSGVTSGLEKSEESDAACDRIGTLDPRADDLQSPAVRDDMKKGEGAGGGIGGVGVGNGAGREGVGVEAATTEVAHGMMRQGDKGTSRCHARASRQEQKRARGAPGSARSGDGIAVRPRPAGDEVVVQQYVLPPMLIGKRKFDLRCFCLVACVEPTLILRHEELYVRRACEPFNMDGPDFVRCRAAHLTNISVQKQHPRFGEDSVWDAHQLRAFLRQRFGGDGAYEKLTQDITRVMRECLLAVLPQLSTRRGCFQLLGFDCLLNQNGALSLLEVNRNPDLQQHTRTLNRVLPCIVDDTIQVVTEVNMHLARRAPSSCYCDIWPLVSSTGYHLVLLDQGKSD